MKLPFKTNFKEMIGGSLDAALKRFLQLERRFKRESELKRGYEAVIDEYMTREYLNKISEERKVTHQPICYLPHHPVLKASSTSTKIGPVFDGSGAAARNFIGFLFK